ncbi:MAG: DUF262 domain-containing protein [Alphaproteobacteria bacterium]|nr:DUF262 domain-containing protein [Alphaproteobacteria bacterium]
MNIETILNHIDSGHIALPEFQRGYVWNRAQVRGLFESLYKRHPVGSLLVWVTDSQSAKHKGDAPLARGVVKLLLDGQQRITSLYGVMRGRAPAFFDGNAKTFTGLQFNLETEKFSFYQSAMKNDPLWIDVTEAMKGGVDGIGSFATRWPQNANYISRLSRLLGISNILMHAEEVTGEEKTLDVVVDIFNRVNSGGTKLSKGDLALAKICADWPEARDAMKAKVKEWADAGYSFSLDWLLRSVNTVLTGEAKFRFLHDTSAEEIKEGLNRAGKRIDFCLNQISSRLGLDHDRVFFSAYAMPVMVRYLDRREGTMPEKEIDKLLFWYAQTGMRGRFSGSVETSIDKDLETISGGDNSLDRLLDELKLLYGGLRVLPEHFRGWNRGNRFYPILYWLTRMGGACDWCSGVKLKANLLGNANKLEMHHIFPKARLKKQGYKRPDVNALANFCFLTSECNGKIRDKLPEQYFPKIEEEHPGALASQWIPEDQQLWKIGNYPKFLEARRALLAEEANRRLLELLHGDARWLEGQSSDSKPVPTVLGGIADEDEEKELMEINDWVKNHGLLKGILAYEHSTADDGGQHAIFDLAWPDGIQEELSEPVALLLNESAETIGVANLAGFRCFVSQAAFKRYVQKEILESG